MEQAGREKAEAAARAALEQATREQLSDDSILKDPEKNDSEH
jgi:hypothetical protein